MDPLILQNIWFFALILLWVLPWKGIALWKSARNGHKYWFIALLVVQTFAILDIIYIFLIAKRKTEQAPMEISSDKF
jgi:methionyl-tRNA synthetase